LIEDNPDDALLLRQMLRRTSALNFDLREAQDLKTGLELLAQERFDAVLLDLQLPDSTGLESLERLQTATNSRVPVVVQTGCGDTRIAFKAIHCGAQECIDKSELDTHTLLRALRYAVERHRSQTALAQSENRLKLLFENAPDAYYLHDMQGNFLDGNKAAEQLVGYPREELIGKNMLQLDLLNEEGIRQAARALALNAQGRPIGPEEYTLRRKDGSQVTVEIRNYPIILNDKPLVLGMARDVSECKSALTALKESEERFRAVWEHSLDGMRLTDHKGRILAVNEAYCELVKLPREKLIGELLSVVYQEQGPGEDLQTYAQQFQDGTVVQQSAVRVQLWNSVEMELDLSKSFVELEYSGKLVLSICRDVSAREQTELQRAAFSQLGHRLSAAETTREAGEIIFDVADQLLGWDACICGLYSSDEERLTHVLSIDTVNGERVECPAINANQALSPLARRALNSGGFLLLKDDPLSMAEGGVPFGNSSRPSASLLFAPIRDATRVLGLLSIQSYTPNAYNEHNLETLQALADHCAGAIERITTQQQTAELLARSPAVLYTLRMEGGKFILKWIGGSLKHWLGFTPAEAQQTDWWQRQLHPQDRPTVLEKQLEVLARGQVTCEYRIRHKNGDYRWVRDELRLVRDVQDEPDYVVGSWLDITERKALEQQLRQVQKMEAVGQLAGGVAHDFNNLLVVMRGNAELLLLKPQQHSPATLECLKQITAASERAANLTRQLLAFSRKQVMHAQSLPLNDVIGNLTKMLNRIIGEQIKLQCQFAPGLPYVHADPGMLEQVLLNLVLNARDAMLQGGELKITTERVTLTGDCIVQNPEARAGEFICLTVQDNGVGIPPENLPLIFEPFFTTKGPGQGTGLGLATVYGIVKQHQGWIEVSSQRGSGSSFKVYLPAMATPVEPPGKEPPELPPAGGTESILLVEDDRAVRQTTRRVLEAFGYDVHEAGSAVEGMDVWAKRAGQISLLLADIVMPEGLSGDELADKLRLQQPALKIILMSGYSREASGKDRGFQQKKIRFLQKPCSSRLLLETVRQCLDQN
jgi:PAS domain S-box-containing protein